MNKLGICDLVKVVDGKYKGKYGIVKYAPFKSMFDGGQFIVDVKIVKQYPDWWKYDRHTSVHVPLTEMKLIRKRWKKKAKQIYQDHAEHFRGYGFSWIAILCFHSAMPLWFLATLLIPITVGTACLGKLIYDKI